MSNKNVAEMHAWLQFAQIGLPEYSDLSAAVNRINALLYRQQLPQDVDGRRLMIGKLRSRLEARYQEAHAEDLSRLAWLCFNDHDPTAARKWAQIGLSINPDDRH